VNYYNENDQKTAQWLRELIAAGLIPAGHVDGRSISEVAASDLDGYIQCHFFAGIGGWPLALALAGWPESRAVWSMSCPCQPFSVAGKGKGAGDERHLWPVAFNLIRERRPVTIIGEQVESAVGHGWLDGISADLEGEGYACGAAVLGAHSVGAPHIRQRLYWVADARHEQQGRATGPGEAQGRRTLGDATGCREVCSWLVQPIVAGLEGYAGDGDNRHESGRERAGETGSTAATSDAGGMVFSDGDRRGAGSASAEAAGYGNSAHSTGGGIVGVADREGGGFRIDGSASGSAGHSDERGAAHWSNSTPILCRDGKTRRVPTEPAFFPLVDGISAARVGILRGAGNAIVPQVAAEFIAAYMEVA
jgi:DNA (cytosine-5)-methyltransferase 1